MNNWIKLAKKEQGMDYELLNDNPMKLEGSPEQIERYKQWHSDLSTYYVGEGVGNEGTDEDLLNAIDNVAKRAKQEIKTKQLTKEMAEDLIEKSEYVHEIWL